MRLNIPAGTTARLELGYPGVAIEERAEEVERLLERACEWAATRPDVDLSILTTEPGRYLEVEAWVRALGGGRVVETQAWGPLTERRFVLPSGLEVEAGIAPPSWASTDPVDPGTRGVVRDGFRVVYDPEGLPACLVEACRRNWRRLSRGGTTRAARRLAAPVCAARPHDGVDRALLAGAVRGRAPAILTGPGRRRPGSRTLRAAPWAATGWSRRSC